MKVLTPHFSSKMSDLAHCVHSPLSGLLSPTLYLLRFYSAIIRFLEKGTHRAAHFKVKNVKTKSQNSSGRKYGIMVRGEGQESPYEWIGRVARRFAQQVWRKVCKINHDELTKDYF